MVWLVVMMNSYLEKLDSLLQLGFSESDIFDAFLLFDNEISKAADFLVAYKVRFSLPL